MGAAARSCCLVIGLRLCLLSIPLPAQEETARPGAAMRFGADCVSGDCHATWNEKRYLHRPVAKRSCASCHAPKTRIATTRPPPGRCVAAWKLTKPESELCSSCHPLVLRNFVHAPVTEGKCTSCHDPHGSDYLHLLLQDPARELCFACHQHKKDDFTERKHGHEPASAGSCILCHDSHSSWNPRLLVKTGAELCLTCHEDVRAEVLQRRHVHDPVLTSCDACHDPHGSDFRAMMKSAPRETCLGCHPRVERLLQTSDNIHGAVETEESCAACHAAHATDLPRLFTRTLMDSCLSCHNEPVRATDGRMLANMGELLRDNPDHHGPVLRADCSSCHNPHASPNFRLLREFYPEEFYVPEFNVESYALCFRCHFKELVLVEKGNGVTRFQHGDVNLHYVHVTRERSRSCRACHAIHASRNPAHLVDTFTYGEWKDAPLGYKKLPNGGSCASACHREVAYERGSKEPVPVVK